LHKIKAKLPIPLKDVIGGRRMGAVVGVDRKRNHPVNKHVKMNRDRKSWIIGNVKLGNRLTVSDEDGLVSKQIEVFRIT
jgi:hypothetical protein